MIIYYIYFCSLHASSQASSWDGDLLPWLDVGIETSPKEKLWFTSWLVPWSTFSSTIVEIEVPSSECFLFLFSWINRMNYGILYNWNSISFQINPLIHHVNYFLFSLFFNDFLISLLPCWFYSSITDIPHHHNDQFNIDCIWCSSITSLNKWWRYSLVTFEL